MHGHSRVPYGLEGGNFFSSQKEQVVGAHPDARLVDSIISSAEHVSALITDGETCPQIVKARNR